jgi:hypothetical protein
MNSVRDDELFMKLKDQDAKFWLSKGKSFFSKKRKDKQKQNSIAIGDRFACKPLIAVSAIPLSKSTPSTDSLLAALHYQPQYRA